jgi:hypothetical protein
VRVELGVEVRWCSTAACGQSFARRRCFGNGALDGARNYWPDATALAALRGLEEEEKAGDRP